MLAEQSDAPLFTDALELTGILEQIPKMSSTRARAWAPRLTSESAEAPDKLVG
jgi:hypothetical protein